MKVWINLKKRKQKKRKQKKKEIPYLLLSFHKNH